MDIGGISLVARTRLEVEAILEQTMVAYRMLAGKKEAPLPQQFFRDIYDRDTADALYLSFVQEKLTLNDYLHLLEKEVAGWPTIRLQVAVRPTERLISRIHAWLIKTLDQVVVIDFAYEPAIMAGTVIEWQGRYLDYSLQKKLKAVVETVDWTTLSRKAL